MFFLINFFKFTNNIITSTSLERTFFDPIEQFELSFFNKCFRFFIFNNTVFYFFLVLIINFLIISCFKNRVFRILFTKYFFFIVNTLKSNFTFKSNNLIKFNFFIFFIFNFIFFVNILGMLDYWYALSSFFILPFFFSFVFFFTNIYFLIKRYKAHSIFLVFPSGCPVYMLPILFLIEILSIFSRLFSLAIRLFANTLSGHILTKILLLILWKMICALSINIFFSVLMLFVILAIILLEFLVAFLQAYAFVTLLVIYFNELFNVNNH